MKEATWAGGAKLTWQYVKSIRRFKRMTSQRRDDLARLYEVTPETIQRAWSGLSWRSVRYQRLPEEWKRCVVCRAWFERRFDNGRHRSDAFWAQKVTCSNACHARRNWARGAYDNR